MINSDREFEISLYGGYEEVWSDTYLLNIRYYNNKKLIIRKRIDGRFYPVSGDSEIIKNWAEDENDFLHRYVQETGEAYDLIDRCRIYDIPFDRLPEYWDNSTGGAVFSAELMRILMDEQKFKLEEAFAIATLFFRDTITAS